MREWPRYVYTFLFYAAIPILVARLWWRGRQSPGYRRNWLQRFGFVPTGLQRPLWVHAVSLGETIAIAPLVQRLLDEHPDQPIMMTSMTPTGKARAEALFGNRIQHFYCPYDLPDALNRFLNRVKPCGCLVVETELWPNMAVACESNSIPLMIVNARLSERSARGYQRFKALSFPLMQRLNYLVAQSDTDAERFRRLGLSADRIEVSGSIKFDIQIDEAVRVIGNDFKSGFKDRFVLMFASSHADEEAQLLAASQSLLVRFPQVLLLVVPRHPERFEPVHQFFVEQLGAAAIARRSQPEFITARTRVLVGDTLGEMLMFYTAANLVVMGGSFVDVGGHNPVEPAALKTPVIMGPYHHNFSVISDAMVSAGGMYIVESMRVAIEKAEVLMSDQEALDEMGQAAFTYAESQRGALGRLYHVVETRLITPSVKSSAESEQL